MRQPLTKLLLCWVFTGLAACASGPATDSATPNANVNVDPAVKSEYQYAVLLMKNGDHEQALQKFAAMVKQHPNLSGIFVNMGIIYLKEERYEDAKNALLQATTVNPANAVAWNHLGIAQRSLGDFKTAAASYQEALKHNAQYANAHLNLAILYDLYLGQLANALKHYQTYQQLSGKDDATVEKWIVDTERRISSK